MESNITGKQGFDILGTEEELEWDLGANVSLKTLVSSSTLASSVITATPSTHMVTRPNRRHSHHFVDQRFIITQNKVQRMVTEGMDLD
ncbi:unnamed protein product [Haemonchus placei]|uniref:Uncharacterized protein n=1 Tax=Haemonchus placei TaxID=6290 RepID=A0A0N4WH64_HAEPC|nr:unnamed protein product [Haemonchus placei]